MFVIDCDGGLLRPCLFAKARHFDFHRWITSGVFLREVSPDTKFNEGTFTKELHEYFTIHIPLGDFIAWLAIDGDKIVATGGICIHDYPPSFEVTCSKRAYIMNVYTLELHRKQGIASTIFARLLNEARARKVGVVTLHATEAGKDLYKTFGFKERYNEMALYL